MKTPTDHQAIDGTTTETGEGVAQRLDFDSEGTAELHADPIRDDLANLRCNMPFVPVVPFPKGSFRIDLANAGDAGYIEIPDNALLVKFSAVAPFFMNQLGAADGLSSNDNQTQGNDKHSADVLVTESTTDWLYCAGMKAISVRTIGNANKIGARFIYRDQV